MAWLRLGDTAATYPKLLECGEHPEADEDTVDLVFGWFMRVAAQSAQHPHRTDYIVSLATARLLGRTRARTDQLIKFAVFGGLMSECEVDGRRALSLINDPEFVHIKTQDVLDWERQRRDDNGKPELTVPVRFRDGDACRYCGRVVNFLARTGKLAGTYDHRPAGAPGDPERSVVACSSCNSSRKDLPLEIADEQWPLLGPPAVPYYASTTVKWLHGHAALVESLGLDLPPLADPSFRNLKAGTVLRPVDPAPDGVRPAGARPADPAPVRVRPAEPPVKVADGSAADRPPDGLLTAPDRSPTGPAGQRQDARVRTTGRAGRAGSGRDGSGQVGTGLVGAGGDGPGLAGQGQPAQPGGRRRRRGRRGRGQSGEGRGENQ